MTYFVKLQRGEKLRAHKHKIAHENRETNP